MNGTPRLRSAFPATPQQNGRSPGQNASPSSRPGSQRLPDIKALQLPKSETNTPLIPFDTIDAPSQRLYVAGIYSALFFWRLYDFYHLTLDETESLWLFMKWVSIDGVFLFGLPGFKIPWLEWSSATMTVLFMMHAFIDGLLMFRIPIPLGSALVALTRLLYDREIAISERHVKPGDVLHNPSLILGRQIIHILPEGSATLNPDNEALCIGSKSFQTSVELPIRINQTNPISIELVRFDLDTAKNESILISSSQVRKMRREAEKSVSKDPNQPLLLHYLVKKTGLYRLHRVIDETKLEVQTRSKDALVVTCPTAMLKSSGLNRCKGDLSDLSIEVRGTPPLQVKYRKTVNNEEKDVSYQSIHPEDFDSPLMRQKWSDALVILDYPDVSWARAYTVTVPLNETLVSSGTWYYSIEKVTDACNNTVDYGAQLDDESESSRSKQSHVQESVLVHDRPRISFLPDNVREPIQMAQGSQASLPIRYTSTGKSDIKDTQHDVVFSFVPYDEMDSSKYGSSFGQLLSESAKTSKQKIAVNKAGLYTLRSVSTPFCDGEVLEPASCVIVSPHPPTLSTTSEPIEDKCAGNPIGLRVSLDLSGTPPFEVEYTIQKDRAAPKTMFARVEGARGQIELKPESAGQYTYTFVSVSDSLYGPQNLKKNPGSVLQQEVKPSVSANFVNYSPKHNACLNEEATFQVHLQGERPWILEYEIIHNGKREKHKISNITDDRISLETGPLTNGGEYSLALLSVRDNDGCKESLKHEAKVFVRHQLPKAGFGTIEGKREVRALEKKTIEMPLRLSGEGPWTINYREPGDSAQIHTKTIKNSNDKLAVSDPGDYEIVSVQDKYCRGVVEQSSSKLNVTWIDRPSVSVGVSEVMEEEKGKFIRKEICEGDGDSVDIFFGGKPPFDVKYRETIKPDHGIKGVHIRSMHLPQQSAKIEMNTTQAGEVEYTFSELGDSNYEPLKKDFLTIQQRVNARPSATFSQPGKVYSFCQGQESGSSEEVIPIKISGKPPLTLELELKHQSKASRSQIITIPNILTSKYNLHLPHSHLQPGNSFLTIRRIRDDRGCERYIEPLSSPRVQIAVHDLPSIAPSEERIHYCVGERISFTLTGQTPYEVFYNFGGRDRKAAVDSPTFRRLAETPGTWTITGVSDAASHCKRSTTLVKEIHAMPSVKVSKGKESRVDIHAGSEAEILFEFGGEPPFEFTYTRSENTKRGDRKHGQILETKTLISEETALAIKSGEEGTYEVVAIRDKYCSFSLQGGEMMAGRSQGLLQEA